MSYPSSKRARLNAYAQLLSSMMDVEDIRAIRHATPQLDEQVVCTLLKAITSRGYSRGQDLMAKWQDLKAQTG